MTVVILILIVILLLRIGIYIYSTINNEGVISGDKSTDIKFDIKNESLSSRARQNTKKPGAYQKKQSYLKVRTNPHNLKAVVEMAIADGVLTIDGREQIKQTAISRGYDYKKVLDEVEKHVRFLEIDSDTKLVDLNEKNQLDFERLIAHKFCKVLFNIKEWAGEKYEYGEYFDNPLSLDFLIEFIGFKKSIDFAVKCKWRQRTTSHGIEFSSTEELNRYNELAKEKNVPVFIVLGLEGKGGSPERLFIVPLKKISKPSMTLKQLKKYEKKVTANFYFDYVRRELK